jgi:hypothetical protein
MRILLAVVFLFVSFQAFSDASEARKAFLPGLSASILSEFGSSNIYPGFNFHYAFVEGVSRPKNSYDFGGYYEWYSEIGFYKELNSNMTNDIFFTCASGVNLSFEKFLTSSRNFLVPYFGAKFGGVFFNKGSGGFFVEPILGTVLLETENIIVNYDCGLFLNTADLSGKIGLHNSLLVNFNL